MAPCFFEVQSHPNRSGRSAFAAMVQFFRATSRFLKTSLATLTFFYKVAARFVSETQPGIVRNTEPKVVDFVCNFCTNSKESKQESAHASCAEDMAITDASSNKNWSEILRKCVPELQTKAGREFQQKRAAKSQARRAGNYKLETNMQRAFRICCNIQK